MAKTSTQNPVADFTAQLTAAAQLAKSYTLDADGMIRDADRKAVGQVKGREDVGFTVVTVQGFQTTAKTILAAQRWVALHQL